ncbi:peptide-methionine (R)-S-oxide reductase MsrB [Ferruginibacter albus]|uniref:peptide-methionine (R)-S-oxide reductase MsrB n=1 Tax=Ferruginibacter albus TaxID=2875540 RepID=UPI0028F40035|nr:peptide-methionine (R)-S-oxide reductase MsrB [Ferruginibacter albus]
MMRTIIFSAVLFISLAGCSQSTSNKTITNMDTTNKNKVYSNTDTSKVTISDSEWKSILPSDVYNIAREKGTERAFTGKYWDTFDTGTYYCAACGNPLFKSNAKFESSCGWPSFFEPISKGSIIYAPDNTYGMSRTEVMCGRCKAHLGHVFEDGPPPTGLRYCINSVILDFRKAQEAEKKFNEKQ